MNTLPSLLSLYHAHGGHRDVVSRCDKGAGAGIPENRQSLLCCKFLRRAQVERRKNQAPLPITVGGVLRVCSDPEMIRVYAERVITARAIVTNLLPFRDRPARRFPREAMRGVPLALPRNCAVSFVGGTRPYPTTIRRGRAVVRQPFLKAPIKCSDASSHLPALHSGQWLEPVSARQRGPARQTYHIDESNEAARNHAST